MTQFLPNVAAELSIKAPVDSCKAERFLHQRVVYFLPRFKSLRTVSYKLSGGRFYKFVSNFFRLIILMTLNALTFFNKL